MNQQKTVVHLLQDYQQGYLSPEHLEETIVKIAQVQAKQEARKEVQNEIRKLMQSQFQKEMGRLVGVIISIIVLAFFGYKIGLRWPRVTQNQSAEAVSNQSQLSFEEINTGTIPKMGDRIAGYKVTSAHGQRISPCPGCSSNHPAVDIGTPTGTLLYVPLPSSDTVEVRCRYGNKLTGLLGEIDIGDTTLQFLHLETCISGVTQGGEAFATTGTAGTGPHADIRAKKPDGTRPQIRSGLIGKALKPDYILRSSRY